MRPLATDGHPAPLNPEDVLTIRNQHLPYRRALLLDAIERIPAASMADNQAFEAGAVAGRSLLSFLGVRYDRKKNRLDEDRIYQKETGDQTDDVKAPDVGGSFVEIDQLSEEESSVLARFIHGVHKASAHFTWKSLHGLDVPTYRAAALLICDLLQNHVYQVEQTAAANRLPSAAQPPRYT
jgi:hypothetical protein